jgi:Flp pilus assembly protein TadD
VRRRRSSEALALGVVLLLSSGARGDPASEARSLLRLDRPVEAEAVLRGRLASAPEDVEAWLALGEVERTRCALDEAEAAYRRALDHDLLDARARAGLAEVLLLSGRPREALREADLALVSRLPRDGRGFRVRALALIELRRYDLARAAARRAAALSPEDPRCLEALAAAEFRSGDVEAARVAYEQATALDPRAEEANLRLGNGFACPSCEKPWRAPGPDAEAFSAAVFAWEAGRLEEAEARFLALATLRPGAYKYRLGLGLVRMTLRRRNERRLGGDSTALYLRMPAPEVEDVARVVRGYEALGSLERHVVRVAIAPARPFWDALVARGATHEVISLEADLTDAVARSELEDQRTFDGRLYGHLRGVGGAQGATGAEKLREAAEFGFNTFAHEFAHQVHRSGLGEALQREVDALYADAIAHGRALDYYAASSADEYFAQGYEAFVSPAKRGCLSETARHTRDELARRDPALLAFLRRVLDTSHDSEEVFRSLRAAASGEPPVPVHAEPAPR